MSKYKVVESRAKRYQREKNLFFLADLFLNLAFLFFAQFSGLAAHLKSWSRGNVFPYLAGFYLLLVIVGLPLRFWSSHLHEKQHALSRQTLAGWIGDEIKKLFLSGGFFILVTGALLVIIQVFPRTWWIIAAFGWLFLTLFVSRILPTVLIPIFYRLKPLPDGPLKERLENLCKKCGLNIPRIDEIAFSQKTVKANAALVGIGKSRRIILGDTLLSHFTDEEIEMVVAHEVGHQIHRHIPKNFVFNFCVVFGGFFLLYLLSRTIVIAFQAEHLADLAIFPILALLGFIGGLAILPAQNAVSRLMEYEADRYAIRTIPSKEIFRSMMQKLASRNLSDPEPPAWLEFLLHDHPSIANRIKRIA
ncbi:MAG: M48 family metallopeptidase [Candidatus Omnitrophica bacterium]|nr:M48 family metallopeptidase [Candidatus Omnitrophota bacterium]